VLGALRVDLDDRRLGLRLVDADVLDGAARATGAGVGDDDAVVRGADLADTLKLDLDGHVASSSRSRGNSCDTPASWRGPVLPLDWSARDHRPTVVGCDVTQVPARAGNSGHFTSGAGRTTKRTSGARRDWPEYGFRVI